MRDIGWAEDGTKEQRSLARLNGVPTVVLEVRRQSGANTVAVIEAVKANLDRLRAAAARRASSWRSSATQSRYIYAALHEINVHLVLGSILACLVVFAFMRDWRSTVIAAVAIPASVIATFGMMAALDFTLNSVTMLALVLMVGIVIDDAIVVLENIFRFIEEKRMTPFEAARAGHRRDRAGGDGDDVLPGGDLRAGLVHVEHLGALPLPVRHHGGRGDPGEPARVVHAHADDERAHVQRGGAPAARARRRARRASRRGFYRVHRSRLRAARSAAALRRRALVGGRRRSRSSRSSSPLYGW